MDDDESSRVARLLDQFVSRHQLGEVLLAPLDVVLTPRRVVQPDIVYVSHARHAIIQDQIHGAPDLIVEVVSPGTWRRDHIEKKALYEQFSISALAFPGSKPGSIRLHRGGEPPSKFFQELTWGHDSKTNRPRDRRFVEMPRIPRDQVIYLSVDRSGQDWRILMSLSDKPSTNG